jgi:hypothetical protein
VKPATRRRSAGAWKRPRPSRTVCARSVIPAVVVAVVAVIEVEGIHQIADRRAVGRDVRMCVLAIGFGRLSRLRPLPYELPVGLDEFQDRDWSL